MGDKDDYLTSYRVFFENFAATVNPEDQLPVQIAGYTITEAELPGEVIYWTTQYLTEKQCPETLMTPLRRIILEEVRVASKKQPIEFGYVADESVYIALRMMQAVTARVNDVCLRYLDNSRLDSLPPPPPPALREYSTVSAATKNSRRAMEDRHVEIGNLEALFGIDTTEPTCFYAVYDGHAGSAAATYCAAHLHQYLVESPLFATDLESAMHDAFLRTDAEFVRKSNQERVYGGSTAVVVCLRGRRLLAAWAGDSQALLAKRMRLMQLVNPHKPDREDERERIISSGGTVIRWGTWRVNGQLAVSRAIGDAQYKPYVTARPEMGVVDLDGDEDFVVVACDGLWDVVSEDAVALSVYQQLAADPDDLKAVAKRLVVQAKRVGSADNISVIVVFLKNPRDIVADNCPPMDLGLDNAAVSAPPFAVDVEPRKPEAVACDADNGVSDSDSEDLGPETAVDIDADRDDVDDHGMDQATAPTPPAHAVEESHVEGNLVDNVAESGEDSEDEWNYYKGEGDREQNASEEADEPPRSETPCQDNSAWESSSVDMNSSPLNPEAPVFIPGTVAGSDMLLAESPRKPLPMDDIELPDVAQFNTEAVVRPAELLDLDNCDQLNGHHNISMEGVTEHLNGNEKCQMESLGFGFNVGVDSDKIKDTELIQDFERIQKDTTDFCNIQVLQTHHTAYNPFAADGDEELFERLKNKERDPMSMSFYQEKDDDTCERFGKKEPHVDLNAVQPLPDSDDEDMQTNGCDNTNENDDDKENVSPELDNLLETESTQELQEPNNDIMMFDDRSASNAKNVNNFMDLNINNANNVQSFSNNEFECSNVTHENVAPTDTPESHKLLFEQIPEIPDGKSSELGFTNEDSQDPCESDKDTRVLTPQEDLPQEIDMENKLDDYPSEEIQQELNVISNEQVEIPEKSEHILPVDSVHKDLHNENEIISEYALSDMHETISHEQNALSPEPESAAVSEPTNEFSSNQFQANVVVDVHQNSEQFEDKTHNDEDEIILRSDTAVDTPEIKLETEIISSEAPDVATSKSPLPADASLPQSPLPSECLMPADSSLPSDSPIPSESPLPVEPIIEHENSPVPSKSPIVSEFINEAVDSPVASPVESQSPLPEFQSHSPVPTEEDSSKVPLPAEVPLPRESPIPSESPLPDDEETNVESNLPIDSLMARQSPFPVESSLPSESPLPTEAQIPIESLSQIESPLPAAQSPLAAESPLPSESPLPVETAVPIESQLSHTSPLPSESLLPVDTAIEESFTSSGLHRESPLPEELMRDSPVSVEAHRDSPVPVEEPKEFISPSEPQSDLVATIDTAESVEVASPTNFEIDSAATTQSPLPEQSRSPLPVEPASERRPETATPRSSPMLEEATEAFEETTTPAPAEIEQLHIEKAPSPATLEAPQVATDAAEPTEVSQETPPAADVVTPAPDIVPDRLRTELVTDIDIGIPESRAQEICVPVTNEIQHDDTVQPGATPPPTPAVEPALAAAPLEPTPLADVPLAAASAAAAVGVAAAATAAAVGAAKAKTPTVKKTPTTPTTKTDSRTPKSAPKPPAAAAARTPASAKRPTAPAAPAKTPTSATKTPIARTTPAKAPSSASKPATTPTRPSAAVPTRAPAKSAALPAKPAPRPAPAPAKEAPAAAKSAPAPRAAAPRPTTRPAAPKPAAPPARTAAAPTAAKPAPRAPAATRPPPISRSAAAPKPKETKPKAPEKPITNGDVKSAKPAARPAPAAPAPRPAPRPIQRAPAAAPPTKSAAPKPATRAPLDKQSKDLANKRITAKAAPPRTAPIKAPLSVRTAVTKPGVKKTSEKAPAVNGLPNGDGAPIKAPPSPPAADNALLPDVIA